LRGEVKSSGAPYVIHDPISSCSIHRDSPRELLRKSNDRPEMLLQFGLVQFNA
jgi:hypothetical protein